MDAQDPQFFGVLSMTTEHKNWYKNWFLLKTAIILVGLITYITFYSVCEVSVRSTNNLWSMSTEFDLRERIEIHVTLG